MKTIVLTALLSGSGVVVAAESALDRQLALVLQAERFTGSAGSQLESRLGRPIDRTLAGLGRLLFFDKILNLHSDNSCAGCHTPQAGFGDTQSIAIGVQNNNVVGPHRSGPRNQRRTPMLVNDAFFPKLMWNARFFAPSGDPFDNAQGFLFPPPEGAIRFPPRDPVIRHLLAAQGQLPPTELTEAAGFTGTRGTLGAPFDPFDDGLGSPVPLPDANGSRNEPIRQAVLARLNRSELYRRLFSRSFPGVASGQPIDFSMVGRALAEFQFTLVFANAPIDRFARGERGAMSDGQKRGALLFFGDARCVTCHAVAGDSNEMFSDFTNRRIGVPQLAPAFGVGKGNVIFDGPGQNEDFGAEQISNRPQDRYKFRTSPLRNVALQPAFFHDGAFTRLETAIAHHLNPAVSARLYSPALAGVARDLVRPAGPVLPLLLDLDPLLPIPRPLTPGQFLDLVEFVRDGLLDARARPENLCRLIPESLPSGISLPVFEGCPGHGRNTMDGPLPDTGDR
jgi:cytochrome c peroxidase